MQFDEFQNLFLVALSTATENAEKILAHPIPREYLILLYGAGYSGELISVQQATEALYINPDEFYRIIDIAVQKVEPKLTTIFVRVSGHKPTQFDKTWDTPKGNGPFKQIIAQIQDLTK